MWTSTRSKGAATHGGGGANAVGGDVSRAPAKIAETFRCPSPKWCTYEDDVTRRLDPSYNRPPLPRRLDFADSSGRKHFGECQGDLKMACPNQLAATAQ